MSRTARLVVVGVMNLALVVVLIVVGIAAHSLGVLAAGADYLADAAAIDVSLLAIRISARHLRATTVAAAINGAWLLVLSLAVIAGAVARLSGRVGYYECTTSDERRPARGSSTSQRRPATHHPGGRRAPLWQ